MANGSCPVEYVVSIIGGKWKVLILWHLASGPKRFAELQKTIRGITHKVLTEQLRELERDHLILRKVYPEIPPKVEYSLSEHGNSLKDILYRINDWGREFREVVGRGTMSGEEVRDETITLASNE